MSTCSPVMTVTCETNRQSCGTCPDFNSEFHIVSTMPTTDVLIVTPKWSPLISVFACNTVYIPPIGIERARWIITCYIPIHGLRPYNTSYNIVYIYMPQSIYSRTIIDANWAVIIEVHYSSIVLDFWLQLHVHPIYQFVFKRSLISSRDPTCQNATFETIFSLVE